jgi:hypothetical protein
LKSSIHFIDYCTICQVLNEFWWIRKNLMRAEKLLFFDLSWQVNFCVFQSDKIKLQNHEYFQFYRIFLRHRDIESGEIVRNHSHCFKHSKKSAVFNQINLDRLSKTNWFLDAKLNENIKFFAQWLKRMCFVW